MTNRSLSISVLAAGSLLLMACSEKPPNAPVEDYSGRPVKVIDVTAATGERETRHPAVIDASQSRRLNFAVGGVIAELPIKDAQEVAAGDLIARLDQRDFESALSSARATFGTAERDYQRAMELAPRGAISESELDQLKFKRDVAKSDLDAAEKVLEDSVLYAPFAGFIAEAVPEVGENISAGSTVAVLIGGDVLEAAIQLPASEIARAESRGDYSAAIVLDASDGREIAAEFSEATLIADATSQTYAVTFTFQEPDWISVLPGMSASLILRSSAGADVDASVSVPLSAIQSDGDGTFVWTVDGSPLRASRRNVAVAPGVGENAVITEGLGAGDRIVAAGAAYLSEGLEVREWAE